VVTLEQVSPLEATSQFLVTRFIKSKLCDVPLPIMASVRNWPAFNRSSILSFAVLTPSRMTVMKFSKPWAVIALAGSTAAGVLALIEAACVAEEVKKLFVDFEIVLEATEDPSALVKFVPLLHAEKLFLGTLMAAAIVGAVYEPADKISFAPELSLLIMHLVPVASPVQEPALSLASNITADSNAIIFA